MRRANPTEAEVAAICPQSLFKDKATLSASNAVAVFESDGATVPAEVKAHLELIH